MGMIFVGYGLGMEVRTCCEALPSWDMLGLGLRV